MRGPNYTIVFAGALSIVLSVVLSSVYMLLDDKQEANRALDKQMSILEAASIKAQSKKEARALFKTRIKPLVVDTNGNILHDKDIKEVEDEPGLYELYAIKDENNTIKGFVYPVVGQGLWSKLYGYLAVDRKGKDVLGITFYNQGETPGLGAEIEKKWFTDNFKGKTLFDNGTLKGIKVTKGPAKLSPDYKEEKERLVDGISGATITGDGVTTMLKQDPMRYEPFFKRFRRAPKEFQI